MIMGTLFILKQQFNVLSTIQCISNSTYTHCQYKKYFFKPKYLSTQQILCNLLIENICLSYDMTST